MSEDQTRLPLLEQMYQQYLTDEQSARFVADVSLKYTVGTLVRLCRYGQVGSRRAATLALGFIGEFSINEVMGRALSDRDRGVRMLADHGIRSVWARQGNPAVQNGLQQLYLMLNQDRIDEAIMLSTQLIEREPLLGEAWNQRAIAFSVLGEFQAAIDDCRQTLNCNRFHFPAAMGMGHCLLQLDDGWSALEAFRLALEINPDLEGVRNHIRQLERSLG